MTMKLSSFSSSSEAGCVDCFVCVSVCVCFDGDPPICQKKNGVKQEKQSVFGYRLKREKMALAMKKKSRQTLESVCIQSTVL